MLPKWNAILEYLNLVLDLDLKSIKCFFQLLFFLNLIHFNFSNIFLINTWGNEKAIDN